METPTVEGVKKEFRRQAQEQDYEILEEPQVTKEDIFASENMTRERFKTGEVYKVHARVKDLRTQRIGIARGKTSQLSGDWLLDITFPR